MEERKTSTFDLAKFAKGYWPIRWKELLQLQHIAKAFRVVPQWVRYTTIFTVGVGIMSILFAGLNLYNALTVMVPASGGVFREAVVGGDMEIFNPLVDRTSPLVGREDNIPEKKINSLLYLPLYTVTHPNYLSDKNSQPTIQPILLKTTPLWEDAQVQDIAQRYKRLAMELRDDITWSNGTKITLDDVQYSFEKLKEAKGNPEFRAAFENVTFEKKSDAQFVLVSSESMPQLLYQAGFSPVSAEYYNRANAEALLLDRKSNIPQVTSGAFVMPEELDNPDTQRKDVVTNPVKVKLKNIAVILKRSSNATFAKVFGHDPYLEFFMLKRFDRIAEGTGEEAVLTQAVAERGFDLFERSYELNMRKTPQELKDLLKMEQKQTLTNTFVSLFYNIKRGPTGYLINQSLRKYITCHLFNYTNTEIEQFFAPIKKERQILPVAFGEVTTIDCGNEYQKILDSDKYVYTTDPTTNKPQVKLKTLVESGEPIELTLIGFTENERLMHSLATFFDTVIGIPLKVVTDTKQVVDDLTNKNYHFALLAYEVNSRDISENYSAKKRDLASIPSNDRITQYNFNENLDRYGATNTTDKSAKTQLIDFFSKELVSFNLYQVRNEYNYSALVKNLPQTIPDIVAGHVYGNFGVGEWYTDTKRVWKK